MFKRLQNMGNTFMVTYLKYMVYPRIQDELLQVKELQEKILEGIIEKTEDTAFGKEHNFAHIQKYKDTHKAFVQRVDICDYEGIKPWIEQAKEKENILWPGKIKRFSASAGTTSRKKNIPITEECLQSMGKAGLDMLATYVTKNPETEIFSGVFWPLIGSIQEKKPDGTILSDVSALLASERSVLWQKSYAFPLELLLEPNRSIKRKTCCEQLPEEDPIVMLGVTSWINEIFLYMQKEYPQKWKSYIKRLQLIVWGGVSAKPYIEFFNSLGIPQIGVYNASEGYFGYQDVVHYANEKAQAPYQLVINHGIRYELVEFCKTNFDNGILKKNAHAIPLRELTQTHIDQKKKFALVMTNNSGLFRYMIGDVIQFVDMQYRFHIVGRTRQCLNLKGEELMEDHVDTVIQKVNQEMGIHLSYYTIGPDKESEPTAHERVIGSTSDIKHQHEVIKKIDSYLQEVNADYEAKRKDDILLKMPKIHIVPNDLFTRRCEYKNKMGGQNKIPKLTNERTMIQELLGLQKGRDSL